MERHVVKLAECQFEAEHFESEPHFVKNVKRRRRSKRFGRIRMHVQVAIENHVIVDCFLMNVWMIEFYKISETLLKSVSEFRYLLCTTISNMTKVKAYEFVSFLIKEIGKMSLTVQRQHIHT